jgi:TetR/AcrR family transcriptional regulator, mexJK operon transcriptional repressor
MPTFPTKGRHRPKQAAVIDAAADLFVQYGYDGTSTEMIAEKAGVSRQTIYNQFENKQALFLAIAADLVQEILAPLSEAVERSADVRETLLTLGRSLLSTLLAPRTIALHRLAIQEVPRFPEVGEAVHEAAILVMEKELASYLKEQNQLPIPDPALAARQYLALVAHPIITKAQLGIDIGLGAPSIEHHLNDTVELFMRAFGAKMG